MIDSDFIHSMLNELSISKGLLKKLKNYVKSPDFKMMEFIGIVESIEESVDKSILITKEKRKTFED